MSVTSMRGGCTACVTAAGLLAASNLFAGQRVSFKPSVTASHVYDDNLHSTASARVADSIFRVSPALDLRYDRPSVSLMARSSFDAERYFSRREFDRLLARRQTVVTLRYLPATRLRLAVTGSHARTTTPQDLNSQTGLIAARGWASRYTATPEATYQIGSRTEATGSYEFGRSVLAGSPSIGNGTGRLTVSRQMTPVDTFALGYQAHRFSFGGVTTTTSHALVAGWTRRFSSLLDATLQIGPRIGNGVGSEISASVGRRVKEGDLAFEYSRSQSASLGQTAVFDVERFGASATARPGRGIELRFAPSATRNTAREGALGMTVYTMTFGVTTPLQEWLSLAAGYNLTLQRGTLGLDPSTVPHAVFVVSLVAATQ